MESPDSDVPVERKSSLRPLLIQPGPPSIDCYTRRVEINVLLDIHSRWELQVFLSKKDPDFLSKWIVKEDENEDFRRFEDERDELESIQETLEIGRESALTDDPDNLELRSACHECRRQVARSRSARSSKGFLEA